MAENAWSGGMGRKVNPRYYRDNNERRWCSRFTALLKPLQRFVAQHIPGGQLSPRVAVASSSD